MKYVQHSPAFTFCSTEKYYINIYLIDKISLIQVAAAHGGWAPAVDGGQPAGGRGQEPPPHGPSFPAADASAHGQPSRAAAVRAELQAAAAAGGAAL